MFQNHQPALCLGPGNGAVRVDFDLGPCDSLGQSLENLHGNWSGWVMPSMERWGYTHWFSHRYTKVTSLCNKFIWRCFFFFGQKTRFSTTNNHEQGSIWSSMN